MTCWSWVCNQIHTAFQTTGTSKGCQFTSDVHEVGADSWPHCSPTMDVTDQDKETFYNSLNDILQSVPYNTESSYSVISMHVLNATILHGQEY